MDPKNIWKIYSSLAPNEWTLITNKECLALLNNYSQQRFVMFRATPRTEFSLQYYRSRSIYNLPGTPKIIMPDFQNSNSYIEMLVQIENYSLEDLLKNIDCEFILLQKLKPVIKIVETLVMKYGPFRLTPSMLKVTKKETIIVWVNQREQADTRKFPIQQNNTSESVSIMLIDLIMIFQGCRQSILLQDLRIQISKEKSITFEKSINRLEKIIIQQTQRLLILQKPAQKHIIPQFLKNKVFSKKPHISEIKDLSNIIKKSVNFQNSSSDFNLKKIQSQRILKGSFRDSPPKINIPTKNIQPSLFNNSLFKLLKPSYNENSALIRIPKALPKSMFIKQKTNNKEQQHPYKSMSQISRNYRQKEEIQKEPVQSEKKNFRDSGNSLATTNFYHSINSSGKVRLLEEDNSLSKNISASFGSMKCGKSAMKEENRFQVKVSKIIEENYFEDGAQNSPQSCGSSEVHIEKNTEFHNMYESEIERDFYDLLFFESKMTKSQQQEESDEISLENEINEILS